MGWGVGRWIRVWEWGSIDQVVVHVRVYGGGLSKRVRPLFCKDLTCLARLFLHQVDRCAHHNQRPNAVDVAHERGPHERCAAVFVARINLLWVNQNKEGVG